MLMAMLGEEKINHVMRMFGASIKMVGALVSIGCEVGSVLGYLLSFFSPHNTIPYKFSACYLMHTHLRNMSILIINKQAQGC